ncbi:Anaerobic sulfatase-maturating enzyme [Propionispora sp. 2/2-37]|uniref:anaerobic sulfatase maturase n=1 Tax=Propionispora sp. 2/2-37 TaxID=1677858 RepID=UPI0006BB9078|nr:anaerobic sulfatase maturase [Propionispora sp. 2/2-37]CUH96783.1 Anaerobic sulfatase-maturating enzyme [Propionispora sp. 2/2-37]
MPPLVLMVKPASSDCNLACSYCFYHSLARERNTASYGRMSDDCLECLVKKAMQYAEGSCTFAFQGGEPTLAGLDFYKQFISLEKKYNVRGIDVQHALQTNGTLITGEWARFLAGNRFMVGLSLDGSVDLHDANRLDVNGQGTYHRVMNALHLLDEYHVDYNVLAVISKTIVRKGRKIYNFFKNKQIRYVQFIPCIEPYGKYTQTYSPSPNEFAAFLMEVFDLWYSDLKKGKAVSIQYFDNLLGLVAGFAPEVCGMSGSCQCNLVVEADGGGYPCDFYATDAWHLGNISEMDIGDFVHTGQARRFVDSSRHIHEECKICKWYSFCRGGCRRFREPFDGEQPGLNKFCKGYKRFFPYVLPRLQILAQKILDTGKLRT